jgi:hypothetical protein
MAKWLVGLFVCMCLFVLLFFVPAILLPSLAQNSQPDSKSSAASRVLLPLITAIFPGRAVSSASGTGASAGTKGCDGYQQVIGSLRVQWRFNDSKSRCPDATFGNCTAITKDEALEILKGKHILFLGDSLSRYQYINLAIFLTTGHPTWHAYPASEISREWKNWNDYYAGTNRRMGGHEVCDCFRDTADPNWIEKNYENRFWFGPSGVRVSFLEMFGDKPLYGHDGVQLGIECWEHAAKASHTPDFSNCTQTYCSPGECSMPADYRFTDVHAALRMLCNTLQPDLVILNSHYWTNWNDAAHATKLMRSFRHACNNQKTKFVWKTTTPTSREMGPAQRNKNLEADNVLVPSLVNEKHLIFDVARILYSLPQDLRGTYSDWLHFCPNVYYGLNQALLMHLSDWLK